MSENRRHGDWPMFVPEDDSEQWELYDQISGPLVLGVCKCEADCKCDDEVPDDGD